MPQINITININESLYIKDPLQTSLGKNMLLHAIILFEEVGFEDFNFKKLAQRMGSTEASIYRYFENKYKLLTYLVSWFWDFIHFLILMSTNNITDPKLKLRLSINTLINSVSSNAVPEYIDLKKLHIIVVENASKVYHTKRVDILNKEGLYQNLKKLVKTISNNIIEIDQNFQFPKATATNIIDLCLNNEYYINHLPSLTDYDHSEGVDEREATVNMINYMLDRLQL